ncbi:MAG TPA: TetR family transcriptional regulator, partial [Pseudomonas sp.]|nr:TetR family transcriptional regulator [Pseudomonas sp.]
LTATSVRIAFQGLFDGGDHLDSQGMLAILKRYMNLVLVL